MKRALLVTAAAVAAAVAAIAIQLWRTNASLRELVAGPAPFNLQEALREGRAVARGDRIAFLDPRHIGRAITPDDRPLIANVAIADLDRDGTPDIVVADAAANRIVWLKQGTGAQFTEIPLADVPGPAHVAVVDIDKDSDNDILVASLGVLFPNNAPIGAVIILEHNGRQSFTPRTIIENVARVSDVEAGDLDGDGDLDLAIAQFGYDQGETRWLENEGNWRFASHMLQHLSGGINAVVADVDSDRDLDIVTLISQEWEEIYVFVNDGRGTFSEKRIFGASNEDFGSSWISVVDLDRDGDVDVLYSRH